MTNFLEQAISCDGADCAANIIQDALGIDSNDVVNYCFPKSWPTDRELRARILFGVRRGTQLEPGGTKMANVYIEPRPKGRPEGSHVDDYVVGDHADHVLATFKTQHEANDWAKKNGHTPMSPRRHQPRMALARSRQTGQGSRASCASVQLVHRRFDTRDLKEAKTLLDELS
jgi:hypothetical protein